jgi:hypothetical protein
MTQPLTDLRVELSPEGKIHFMPPCGVESDEASVVVFYQLAAWAKADGRGRANGSSAGFTLPDGSVLSTGYGCSVADCSTTARRVFEKLVNPERIGGDAPIDGFVLDLAGMWS